MEENHSFFDKWKNSKNKQKSSAFNIRSKDQENSISIYLFNGFFFYALMKFVELKLVVVRLSGIKRFLH